MSAGAWFAAEWDRVARDEEAYEIGSFEASNELTPLIDQLLDAARSGAPLWNAEWISPFDAAVAASMCKRESGSRVAILDSVGGNVGLPIARCIEVLKPSLPIEVFTDGATSSIAKELASVKSCVGLRSFNELGSRVDRFDSFVCRLPLAYSAMNPLHPLIRGFVERQSDARIIFHEFYPGYRYPFQYHNVDHIIPNILHVVETLVSLGFLKTVFSSGSLRRHHPMLAEPFEQFPNQSALLGVFEFDSRSTPYG